MNKKYKVVVIGARGYVGNELLPLLYANEQVNVVAVSSRQLQGEKIRDHIPNYPNDHLRFSLISTDVLKNDQFFKSVDVFFLALPNTVASDYVDAIMQTRNNENQPIIIDISADHRFQSDWIYGLPELNRDAIKSSKRIANPGCYATACMLGLAPFKDKILGQPHAFGVSGYSGAGKTPSDKNNQLRLKNNFMPYKLTGHMHENEVSHQLNTKINFMPHVMPHFRGISVTLSFQLKEQREIDEILEAYKNYYQNEVLISVSEDIPEIINVQNKVGAEIGGLVLDKRSSEGTQIRLVVTLDNLLKGAASQAIQNMNLALGIPELSGINHSMWS